MSLCEYKMKNGLQCAFKSKDNSGRCGHHKDEYLKRKSDMQKGVQFFNALKNATEIPEKYYIVIPRERKVIPIDL